MRILVAETVLRLARLTELILRHEGHEVLGPAGSIHETLGLASDALPKPDLALVDVHLDGDGTGLELGYFLSELYGTPVLFFTDRGWPASIGKAGMGYIEKPYTAARFAKILVAVEIHLRGEPVMRSPPGLRLNASWATIVKS